MLISCEDSHFDSIAVADGEIAHGIQDATLKSVCSTQNQNKTARAFVCMCVFLFNATHGGFAWNLNSLPEWVGHTHELHRQKDLANLSESGRKQATGTDCG